MLALEDAVIVVAHPDDEILWCSSILSRCKALVVCFGPSASSRASWDAGRARLIEEYPLAKARFLNLRQGNASGTGDWNHAQITEAGINLRRPSASYEENGRTLLSLLRPILAGEWLVFTHNPWGEYGNEEHVQVSEVVRTLRDEMRFDLFVDGYVSNRSFKLMLSRSDLIEGPPLAFETDATLAAELKNLYLEYDCWTWWPDYVWPEWETFYRVKDRVGGGAKTTALPLNYIKYDFKPNLPRRVLGKVIPSQVRWQIEQALDRFKV